jgi:hypothetical protein
MALKATKKVIDDNERIGISFTTYNVDLASKKEILNLICTAIKTDLSDVISLLDVTVSGFNEIATTLEEYYVCFQVFIDEGDESGTVILCKKSTIDISSDDPPYYFDYSKGSGKIVGTGLIHKKTNFIFNVLAVKFDNDVNNSHIRSIQSETVAKILSKLDNYVLLGDINSSDLYREKCEEILLDQKLSDCWTNMGCQVRVKYTYDGQKNPLIKDGKQTRNSRIYYKSKCLLPKSLSLNNIKTYKFYNVPIPQPLSPYYGLSALFMLKFKPVKV